MSERGALRQAKLYAVKVSTASALGSLEPIAERLRDHPQVPVVASDLKDIVALLRAALAGVLSVAETLTEEE